MPYFKSWARAVAALPLITDISDLWGYWRSDTGVNGKLAVNFDNTVNGTATDYLELGSVNKISRTTGSNEAFSIHCVAKTDTLGNYGCLFDNDQIGIFSTGTGNLWVYLYDSVSGNAWFETNNSVITTGSFQHITITYDGNNSANPLDDIEVYIDNSVQAKGARSQTFSNGFKAAGDIQIGSNNSGSQAYDGALDQFIFFNKVLTTDERITLYNGGSGLKYGDLTGSETFYSSIAAFYDFDSPKNFGRDSHQETHAVSFNGTTGLLAITNADQTSLDVDKDTAFSCGMWVKFPSGADDTHSLIGKYASSLGWALYTDNWSGRKLTYRQGSSAGDRITGYGSTVLADDTWYHIVMTKSTSTSWSGVQFYINGVAETMNSAIDAMTLATTNTEDFTIAKNTVTSFGLFVMDEAFFYAGELDETTYGEISTLYNGGIVSDAKTLLPTPSSATLVSSWSINEQDHLLIGQDSQGTNHLTPTNISEADLVGGCKDARTQYLDLDGATSLDITDPFGLDGITEPSYTIYTEVTIDSGAGSQYWTLTSGNPGLRIDNTGGTIRWYHIWGGNFSGGRYDSLLTVGETCKLTFVYDGTQVASGFSLYKNGSLVTKSASYDTQLGALGADAVIPWGFDGTTNYNNDKIHCLWFFNDNLTGIDLTAINSLPNKATLDDYTGSKTNLAAAYDFENSVDLGKDSHSTNHLTVNGSPTVGSARETSMDLLEVGIDNSNAVGGVVTGTLIDQEQVNEWMDLSGGNNHLLKFGSAEPPYWDDDSGVTITSSRNLETTGNNAGITGDFTIFVIETFTDVLDAQNTISTQVGGTYIRNNSSGQSRNSWATSPSNSSESFTNNVPRIVAHRCESGVAADVWFDGVKDVDFTDNVNIRTTDGALKLSNSTWISEAGFKSLVVYQRALTDDEMKAVFADLNTRYGIY